MVKTAVLIFVLFFSGAACAAQTKTLEVTNTYFAGAHFESTEGCLLNVLDLYVYYQKQGSPLISVGESAVDACTQIQFAETHFWMYLKPESVTLLPSLKGMTVHLPLVSARDNIDGTSDWIGFDVTFTATPEPPIFLGKQLFQGTHANIIGPGYNIKASAHGEFSFRGNTWQGDCPQENTGFAWFKNAEIHQF